MEITLGYETKARAESCVMLPIDSIIRFVSDTYKLSELVIVARNGDKTIKHKTKDGTVDVAPLLFAGLLEMSVHLIVKGQPAKKWDVTPIILREVDNALGAFDEIADLRSRVAELEKKTTVMV